MSSVGSRVGRRTSRRPTTGRAATGSPTARRPPADLGSSPSASPPPSPSRRPLWLGHIRRGGVAAVAAREHRPGRPELRHRRPRSSRSRCATGSGSGSGRRSSPSSPWPSRRCSPTPTPASSASTPPSSTPPAAWACAAPTSLRRVEVPNALPLDPHRRPRLGGAGRGHRHARRLRRLRRPRRVHQRGLPPAGRRQAAHRRGARGGARHRRRARLRGRAAQADALADQKGSTDDQPTRSALGPRPPRSRSPSSPPRAATTTTTSPTAATTAATAAVPPARRRPRPTARPRSSSAPRTSASRDPRRDLRPVPRRRRVHGVDPGARRLPRPRGRRPSSPATSTSRPSTPRRCSSSSTSNAGEATADVDETVELLQSYLDELDLVALEPSDAVDTNAFVVTQETSDELGLTSLSDLADQADLTLGAPADCETNPFCLPGLQEVYGVDLSAGFTALETGAIADALDAGEIDIALLFSTDSRIADERLGAARGRPGDAGGRQHGPRRHDRAERRRGARRPAQRRLGRARRPRT